MSRGQLPRTREFFPRMKERRTGRYVRRYRNWRPQWVLGVGALGAAAESAGQQLLVMAESFEDAFLDLAAPYLSAPSAHAPGPGVERPEVGSEVAGGVPAPVSEVGRQVVADVLVSGKGEGQVVQEEINHASYVCGEPTPPAPGRGSHPQLVIIDETPFCPQPRKDAKHG